VHGRVITAGCYSCCAHPFWVYSTCTFELIVFHKTLYTKELSLLYQHAIKHTTTLCLKKPGTHIYVSTLTNVDEF